MPIIFFKNKEKLKSWFWITLAVAGVITLIAMLVLPILDAFLGFNLLGEKTDKSLGNLHAGGLIILTAILIIVAWIQLRGMSKTSRGDFLLRIHDRYGSDQIVKARTIIHELYCQTRLEGICTTVHIEKISKKIKEMGNIDEAAEKFICLLNFLDFLETIAYFSNQKFVSVREIEELMGGSLNYYYKVFKPWIYYRRQKYNDNSYYCELENLIKKIESLK